MIASRLSKTSRKRFIKQNTPFVYGIYGAASTAAPKNIVVNKHCAHGRTLKPAELHGRGEEVVAAGGDLAQVEPLEHAYPRPQKRLVRGCLIALCADGKGVRAYELQPDIGKLLRGAAVKICFAAALYEQAFAFLWEIIIDILARYCALGRLDNRARADKRLAPPSIKCSGASA